MDWDDVRIFLAVARAGSLSAAAARLGLSSASVARHVEALEARVGTTLFLKSRAGYVLSGAGAAVVEDAERAEGALAALSERASGAAATLSGTVRVAMPETFASDLLLSRLAPLLAAHDGLVLEIVTAVRVADLTRREADIALRIVRPETGKVVVSRVGAMTVALYAASDYSATHPAALGTGQGHRVVAWDEAFQTLRSARWLAETLPDAETALRATSITAQIAACAAGIGIAALPCFLGDACGLARLGDAACAYKQDIWLVVHRDIAATARIRAVTNAIRAALHDATPLLAGAGPR